ncbi:unnamed protein product [Pleuronectes platessa]|uniref:Uncharacterized protein n=1 Tax=Pleuronectes platessa TaxID=8262 RepID=A0A9N7TZE5_PLEPL|nr:unnamed protein product [Pleuronectes platessa]
MSHSDYTGLILHSHHLTSSVTVWFCRATSHTKDNRSMYVEASLKPARATSLDFELTCKTEAATERRRRRRKRHEKRRGGFTYHTRAEGRELSAALHERETEEKQPPRHPQ